jgi:hypothetical protein
MELRWENESNYFLNASTPERFEDWYTDSVYNTYQ